MAIFLGILCILAFLSGLMGSFSAETIFQQMMAAISFVTSAILLIGCAIVNAIDKFHLATFAEKKEKP